MKDFLVGSWVTAEDGTVIEDRRRQVKIDASMLARVVFRGEGAGSQVLELLDVDGGGLLVFETAISEPRFTVDLRSVSDNVCRLFRVDQALLSKRWPALARAAGMEIPLTLDEAEAAPALPRC